MCVCVCINTQFSLCACMHGYLRAYLPVCLLVCQQLLGLSVCLTGCLPPWLPVCLSICLCAYGCMMYVCLNE